jgi:flagellum-specific peptidoglycan hydrolase FlgJ
VYEAQTPAVVQQLRQKQMENLQEAERTSMGKLIERAAAPPKPPSAEMLEKYGKLRRDRDATVSIAQRAEREIGLRWVPGIDGEPGHYQGPDGTPVTPQNISKIGIQGIGTIEQWLPDFVYSTMGGVTAEGYQVRGAAEAMAYAQIRQMQPTGTISNADVQASIKAGALDTEAGMLKAMTRIRLDAEQQSRHDAAQYGPDVVAEYERRFQTMGGDTGAAPAVSRRPTIEAARAGAAALRSEQRQAAPGALGPADNDAPGSEAALMEPRDRMAQVAEDVQQLAGQELPPEGIAILVAQAAHESGNGDSQGAAAGNMFGHKRTGNRPGITANTTEGEGAAAHRTRAEFALYPSIADGVADHISLLKRRYPRAWEALEAGDVDAYVAALKDGNYFTGNETAYANSLRRRL